MIEITLRIARMLKRLFVATILIVLSVGFFIARYFFCLVSSMTKIFAP